jgi:ADP-ribose pyrophosphatase
MSQLLNVTKQTNNKFLNIYEASYKQNGETAPYFIASRKETVEELDCNTGKVTADAAMIVPVYENGDVLFIKQFRKAINDYVYEFPAGLIDKTDASSLEGAKRELHEETGLEVEYIDELLDARYLSVGMSDESVAVYMAQVKGELSKEHQEKCEEIDFKIVKIDDLPEFIQKNKVAMQASLLGCILVLNHRLGVL